MRGSRAAFCGSVLVLSGVAHAAGTLPLGLDEAIERARAASARLAALESRSEAAGQGLFEARAEGRPTVDLRAGYVRLSSVPELRLDLPGVGPTTIFPDIADNFEARIDAQLPLYTGGRVASLVRAAEGERAVVEENLRAAGADVVLETEQAYWSLSTAIERERVLARSIEAYDAHRHDAENRERLGLAARNEVLAIAVERDRAELARVRAAGEVEVREAELARLLDLDLDTRVVPIEPFEATSFDLPQVDVLVDAALAARPEIDAARARAASITAREGVERAASRPSANLSAAYAYADPNRRILPPRAGWDDTWEVGAHLTLRLSDGGRSTAAVRRTRAEAAALRFDLADLERSIRLEVVSRRSRLETARRAIEVALRNVSAAEENRRVAGERYRAGVVSSSELLDAETGLLAAELEQAESLAAVRLATAALERAVGRRFP